MSWIGSRKRWAFDVERIWIIGCVACGRLAYSLQNIAPAEAGNGPNPEYPWPHEAPAHCPAGHTFALWNQLTNTGQGRKLMEFVEHAIVRFEELCLTEPEELRRLAISLQKDRLNWAGRHGVDNRPSNMTNTVQGTWLEP